MNILHKFMMYGLFVCMSVCYIWGERVLDWTGLDFVQVT